MTEQVIRLLICLNHESLGAKEAMTYLNLRHRPTFHYDYLQPALKGGFVEMTQQNAPNSPSQKYQITIQGQAILAKMPIDPDDDLPKIREKKAPYGKIIFNPLNMKTEQVTEQVAGSSEQVKKLLKCLKMKPLGTKEAMLQLNLNHRPTFLYEYIKPALENNLIEMTHPDKPTSPRQKYRVVDFIS